MTMEALGRCLSEPKTSMEAGQSANMDAAQPLLREAATIYMDEWDKMWSQIWERISEELKLLNSYIQEIFESFAKTTQNFGGVIVNEKPVQKSFKQPRKKNHIYKKSTPICRVEKKNPKHLPYQRRYY